MTVIVTVVRGTPFWYVVGLPACTKTSGHVQLLHGLAKVSKFAESLHCSFTAQLYTSIPVPWTVTRSSLRVLRRLLQRVLLLVLFPRSRSAVGGVPGLCWLRRVPLVR